MDKEKNISEGFGKIVKYMKLFVPYLSDVSRRLKLSLFGRGIIIFTAGGHEI